MGKTRLISIVSNPIIIVVVVIATFLNGPIFSDFGPKSDFFGQKGPKMV